MRKAVGVVAASAAVALIGAGAGVSAAAPHASSAGLPMPTIKVKASKHSFKASGPTTFTPGRVRLVLKATADEPEAELVSLNSGYTFKKARADLTKFFTQQGSGKNGSTPKSALKALNRVVDGVNFYGGLDVVGGTTESATVVLPTAGKYFLVNDTHNLPKVAKRLTVTGAAVNRAAPKSSATVTALTKRRFGGAKTLPRKGTITFKNKSTESPHFLSINHVKKGTTKKQVLNSLQSQGRPSWLLKGQISTDVLGEGHSMTLHYSKKPKGKYVELCFFPDPKTGMPHALMGMIRFVHVK